MDPVIAQEMMIFDMLPPNLPPPCHEARHFARASPAQQFRPFFSAVARPKLAEKDVRNVLQPNARMAIIWGCAELQAVPAVRRLI